MWCQIRSLDGHYWYSCGINLSFSEKSKHVSPRYKIASSDEYNWYSRGTYLPCSEKPDYVSLQWQIRSRDWHKWYTHSIDCKFSNEPNYTPPRYRLLAQMSHIINLCDSRIKVQIHFDVTTLSCLDELKYASL